MSQAVYNQFMKVLDRRNDEMTRPIVARAKELKILGYNVEQAASILSDEGNNLDLVEAALYSAYDYRLAEETVPRDYESIKNTVRATIYTESSQEIVKVLTGNTPYGSIMTAADAAALDLENNINYCKRTRSESVLNEIHAALKPFINNMIIELSLAAREEKIASAPSPFEEYIIDKWSNWFGLWSPTTQVGMSKIASEKGTTINVEEYEGGEYAYCPKYKTEINVDNVCKFAKCPFYKEIHVASREAVRKCHFTK